MKLAAAHAIADHVENPHRDHILPTILDRDVTRAIARAVRQAAVDSGCARDL